MGRPDNELIAEVCVRDLDLSIVFSGNNGFTETFCWLVVAQMTVELLVIRQTL